MMEADFAPFNDWGNTFGQGLVGFDVELLDLVWYQSLVSNRICKNYL